MKRLDLIYEGKAKKVYNTDNEDYVIIYYKDDATAFNGEKKGTIEDKGIMNNKISAMIFDMLEKKGIETHFEKLINDREQLCKKVKIIPLEVIVRNTAAGSISRRLGILEGTKLKTPVLEFSYKDDSLGDPMVNESHIRVMGWASEDELRVINGYALEINQVLSDFLKDLGIVLIDFKLEFGKTKDGTIILADEISPDTCRFWDSTTGEKLDKDRFRRDLGNVEGAYREVMKRLMGE